MKLAYWMYVGPAHIGTLRVTSSFKNVHAVMHGPLGDDYFNVMRSMLDRERNVTPVSTSIVDRHVLSRGSADKVTLNLSQQEGEQKPDLIVLTPTCTSSILQEDLANFCERVHQTSPIPVLLACVNHYRVNEYQAADRTLEQICHHKLIQNYGKFPLNEIFDMSIESDLGFSEPVEKASLLEPEGCLDLSQDIQEVDYKGLWNLYRCCYKPRINILGVTTLAFHGSSDIRETVRILHEIGYDINIIMPNNSTIEEIGELPRAVLNIVLYRETGLQTAQLLKQHYDIGLIHEIPIGLRQTERFVHEINRRIDDIFSESIGHLRPRVGFQNLDRKAENHPWQFYFKGTPQYNPETGKYLKGYDFYGPAKVCYRNLIGRGDVYNFFDKELTLQVLRNYAKTVLEAKTSPLSAGRAQLAKIWDPGYGDFEFSMPQETTNFEDQYEKDVKARTQKAFDYTQSNLSHTSHGAWFSRSIDCQNLTGKTAVVFGDATHAATIAQVLSTEFGIRILFAGTYCKNDEEWFRKQVIHVTNEVLITEDNTQVSKRIKDLQPSAIFGTQTERHTGKKLDIPCSVISPPMHVQNFRLGYSPFVGFEGMNQICDLVYNTYTLGMEDHLLEVFGGHDIASSTLSEEDVDQQMVPIREMLSKTNEEQMAGDNSYQWDLKTAALAFVRMPGFVHEKAKANTEEYALYKGISFLTEAVMKEAEEWANRGKPRD